MKENTLYKVAGIFLSQKATLSCRILFRDAELDILWKISLFVRHIGKIQLFMRIEE